MTGTRILHLADLHLGDRHDYLGAGAQARRVEANGLLSRLADHVLRADSGIGGVIIAGDLFDLHDPPAVLVDSVLADLRRMADAGVRLLTVPGNHDEYSYPKSVYRARGEEWPGTLVRSPVPTRIDRWELSGHAVDLYAMAFVAGRSRPPYDRFELEPTGTRTIGVLHGSLDTNWSDRSLPLKSEALAAIGLDYLALGHIHQPLHRRLGSGWACYPGRIEGGGFHDPGCGEIVTIDVAQETLVPRRTTFPARTITSEEWDISGCNCEEDLGRRFEDAADPARICRVRLRGVAGFPFDGARLQQQFAGRFAHLEVETAAGAAGLQVEEIAAERTIRGLFVRLARERIAACERDEERLRGEAALRFGLAAFAAERADEGAGPGKERG